MRLLHGLAVRVKASYFQTGSPSRCNQIISHAHSVHPLACVQEPKNPLTCCYLEHSRCYTPVSTFHIPSIQASQLKIHLSTCAPHLDRHRLPFLSTEACGHGQAHKGAWPTSLHGSQKIPPLSWGTRQAPAESCLSGSQTTWPGCTSFPSEIRKTRDRKGDCEGQRRKSASTLFSEGIGASLEKIMPCAGEISEKKRVCMRCAWTVLW